MSRRRINLDVPDLPNEQHMAWLRANDIDPFDVPAAQEVLVDDGQITYVKFERDADGIKIIGPDGCEKVLRTVPLVSAPEDHGL